ncbi:hypothetical protein Tco_1514840 [Tanacetum coccineum]
MKNSKRGSIPMQEKLRLSKSQGASTPAELKRMKNVPYACYGVLLCMICDKLSILLPMMLLRKPFGLENSFGFGHCFSQSKRTINMYCDNTGAITISNEFGVTKGARHFRAKVHYLHEVIEFGDIKFEKVHTDDNLADPFTKALTFPKH